MIMDHTAYKKIVSKGSLPFAYMKIRLDSEDIDETTLNGTQLKVMILDALKRLFGEVGKSINVDVMKFNEANREAILRVSYQGHTKLWSALTVYGNYGDYDCAFRVLQVSEQLMGLATNSREAFFDCS